MMFIPLSLSLSLVEQQTFKVRVPYEPYFYIAVRDSHFAEVETYLRCSIHIRSHLSFLFVVLTLYPYQA